MKMSQVLALGCPQDNPPRNSLKMPTPQADQNRPEKHAPKILDRLLIEAATCPAPWYPDDRPDAYPGRSSQDKPELKIIND